MQMYRIKVYGFNGRTAEFTAGPTILNDELYLYFPDGKMRKVDKTAVMVDVETDELVYNPRDLTPLEGFIDMDSFHSRREVEFLRKHPEWPKLLELDWDKTKWRNR